MTDTSVFAPGGHVLVRAVGRGESSVVWEARRLATGAPVAVKVLDADVPAADALCFLAAERAAMPVLARHPNVVTVLDAGVQDERPWLAMELCRRGSLAAHVAEVGPLDGPTALRALARLADALVVAHGAGVLHGNIKPGNVLLTDAGEPGLSDFGIAAGVTPRSDVRALGATLVELVAGAGPDQVLDDLCSLLHAMAAPDGVGPASMTEVAKAAAALARDHGITLTDPVLGPLPADTDTAADPPTELIAPPPDGWSMPLPAEQVLTFDPQGSAARTPFSADPDGAPLFTTPAPFRPRDEDEPEEPRRLPFVAASVLAVLVTVGAVFGISQGRNAEPAAPLSVSPAALVPTTTPAPEPTPTPSPTPTAAESTTTARTTTTRPRATRATRAATPRATATKSTKSSDSDDDDKKKKKKSDD